MKKIMMAMFAACAFLVFAHCIGTAAAQSVPQTPSNGCALLPNDIAALLQSSAPWYCPINALIYQVWENNIPIALAAILFAITIAGIIFMVGIAFRSDRIRNFAIGELYEAMASAIIVGFFLYICAVMFGLGPAIAVGGINPYATAFNLITTTIGQAQGLYNSMYQINMVDSFYTTISFSIQSKVLNYIPQVNSALGLGQVAANIFLSAYYILPAQTLGTLIIDGLAGLYSQYYLIAFFSIAAIPAFLVPGVIFRVFFPTRALGGMLIALAIGFYLVMPTMFAMAYYFTSPTLLSGLANSAAQLNRWGSGTGAEQNALSASSPLILALNGAQSAMTSFWLLVLFYPALIIAVTYVFVTQLANFIGGASRLGNKMRGFV